VISREDLYRKYIDIAFSTVCEYKSPQTGFIHVHPDLYKGKAVQVAPTYENFLFALLLMRKKKVEHVKEARVLLQRLLKFQVEGNFPFFLTEYPACRDKYLPFRLLPLFSLMLDECSPLLGKELCSEVQTAQKGLFSVAKEIASSMGLPRWALLSLQKEKGWDAFIASKEWMRPSTLGRALITVKSKEYMERALSLWGEKGYEGPCWGAFHFGAFPEITSFDCLMSLYTKTALPPRQWPYLTALECARISPSSLPERAVEKAWYTSKEWQMEKKGKATISCALFTPLPHQRPGFCPIRIIVPEGTLSVYAEVLELSAEKGRRCLLKVKTKSLHAYIERSEMSDFVQKNGGSLFDPFKGVQIGDLRFGLCQETVEAMGSIAIGDRPEQRIKTTRGLDWKIIIEPLRGESVEFLTLWIEA